MTRFLLIALLCLSPVLASAQAIAPQQPMLDAAERHSHDGVKFSEEGNYEAAWICFKSGYKLSGEPDFLQNLSLTANRPLSSFVEAGPIIEE